VGGLVVSLLTDYGLGDGFVGALHGVIARRAPGARVIDITHGIAPQDVRAGALALQRAVAYVAPGVVVAVVDPGVGTARRAVGALAHNGLAFVGPDNGLLLPAIEACGGPAVVVELADRGYWLSTAGPTFAGRDVFAPAAAELALGRDLLSLGDQVGPGTLVRLPLPVNRLRQDGALEAEVTWVDRYGNIQLAAQPQDWPPSRYAASGEVRARLVASPASEPPSRGGGAVGATNATRAQAFGDLRPDELGLIVDSYGHLALVLAGASAAGQLGAAEGDLFVLEAGPAGAVAPAGSPASPPPGAPRPGGRIARP